MGLSQFQIKLLQFIDCVKKNLLNFMDTVYFLWILSTDRVTRFGLTVLIFEQC